MTKAYLGEKQIARIHHQGQVIFPDPVRDGLVLWYDFMGCSNDNPKRNVAEDLSGNGRQGDLINFAYQGNSGFSNKGLTLDGVDDYINLKPIYTVNPELTWEAVINVRQLGKDQMFLRGASTSYYFRITSRKLFGSVSAGSQRIISGIKELEEGKSYHVVMIANGADIALYLNGELDNKITYIYPLSNFGSVVHVGRWQDTDPRNFSGDISVVREYNRALAPQEVQHNYQMEKERWNL